MRKRIVLTALALLALLLIAAIVLCLSFRTITVASGKQYIDRCPRLARPGQEVTVTTAAVTDGEIYVSGADGEYVQPGVYVFTMPDENVRLRVTVVADPNGA